MNNRLFKNAFPCFGDTCRAGKSLSPKTGLTRITIFSLAGLMLVLASFAQAGAGLRLKAVISDTGQVAFCIPIKTKEKFTLWFMHSYDRAFFAEHYQALGPGEILLTHMTFKSNLNGEGFEYTDFHLRPDGVGELRNINRKITKVHFMMGSPDMADHTVIRGKTRTRLAERIRPGTLVDLIIEDTPCPTQTKTGDIND